MRGPCSPLSTLSFALFLFCMSSLEKLWFSSLWPKIFAAPQPNVVYCDTYTASCISNGTTSVSGASGVPCPTTGCDEATCCTSDERSMMRYVRYEMRGCLYEGNPCAPNHRESSEDDSWPNQGCILDRLCLGLLHYRFHFSWAFSVLAGSIDFVRLRHSFFSLNVFV